MMTTIIVGLIIFITHALEAITGFGCTVLALPFITALIGLQRGVIVLAVLAWLLALYIVITKFKSINFKEFLKIILFAGLGLPIGMILFNYIPAAILKKGLGVFIIGTALIQLYKLFIPVKSSRSLPPFFYYLFLFLGGIIHGAFASGGPFIVLYASKNIQNKAQFRATLCLLWTSLNTVLMVSYFLNQKLNHEIRMDLFILIPFLIVGIIAGESIHHKVNELLFKKIVFSVLLLVGIVMLF